MSHRSVQSAFATKFSNASRSVLRLISSSRTQTPTVLLAFLFVISGVAFGALSSADGTNTAVSSEPALESKLGSEELIQSSENTASVVPDSQPLSQDKQNSTSREVNSSTINGVTDTTVKVNGEKVLETTKNKANPEPQQPSQSHQFESQPNISVQSSQVQNGSGTSFTSTNLNSSSFSHSFDSFHSSGGNN